MLDCYYRDIKSLTKEQKQFIYEVTESSDLFLQILKDRKNNIIKIVFLKKDKIFIGYAILRLPKDKNNDYPWNGNLSIVIREKFRNDGYGSLLLELTIEKYLSIIPGPKKILNFGTDFHELFFRRILKKFKIKGKNLYYT